MGETLVLSISIPLLAIILIFGVLVVYFLNRGFKDNSLKVKTVEIDFENKVVTMFIPRTLEKSTSYSYTSFCNLFAINTTRDNPEDFVLVDDFISDIFEHGKITNNFFVTDGRLDHNTNVYYYCLIEVLDVDFEKKILHVNVYYYKNIPVFTYGEKRPSKRRKYEKAYRSTTFDLQKKFSSGSTKKVTGASYMFTITSIYKLNSLKFDLYVYWSLYDILAKHNKSFNKIIVHDPDENGVFIVHDFNNIIRKDSLKFIKIVEDDFKLFLQVNKLTDMFKINCAVVEHQNTKNDYSLAMKDLRSTMQLATKQNKPYVFFNDELATSFYFDELSTNEAKKVIEKNQLLYTYEPIYDCSKLKIYGWNSYVNCSVNLFRDIKELELYAEKLTMLNSFKRQIISHISSKASRELASYPDDSHKVFISAYAMDIQPLIKMKRYLASIKSIDIVFTFDENELREGFIDYDVINLISELKETNKLALFVNDQNYILPNELYSKFDYFMFNSYSSKDVKEVTHNAFVLKKSIEKILRYKKDIILKNVLTLNDAELRINSGLKYLCGPGIGEQSDMFIPVNPKTIDKIRKLNTKK